MPVRTVIEHGPKDKRMVAFGIDWPGWSRGAKSAELALEMLESFGSAIGQAVDSIQGSKSVNLQRTSLIGPKVVEVPKSRDDRNGDATIRVKVIEKIGRR